MKNNIILSIMLVACLAIECVSLSSCGEDRTDEYNKLVEHNEWLLAQMREVYLWGDELPEEYAWKDYFAEPAIFFSKLTAKGKNDKWSFIEVDTLLSDPHSRGNYNHYNSYGMDFILVTDPTGTTSKQYVRVLNVLADSPADRAGLKRNDFILSFDGFKLSSNNISKLVSGTSHKLKVANIYGDEETNEYTMIGERELELEASEYVEDIPFPVCKIFLSDEKKIGYLMCNRLTPGNPDLGHTTESDYQDKMDQYIARLRVEGITELVLDLRFCNYGTLDMAHRLASYIANKSFAGNTFAKTIWNTRFTSNNKTYTLDTDLQSQGLNLSRVVIIQSSYTTGAAEWLIHGLASAEFPTFLIGTKTAGQNVLTQQMGHEYHIFMNPAVAYVADVNDEYDYSSGITPDEEFDEQNLAYLKPFGSTDEALLKLALKYLSL